MQERAIAKAVELGTAGTVRRVAFGHYRVPSTSQEGVEYVVRHARGIDGEAALTCTCPSGYRPACVHRAGVWLAKREAEGVHVTGVKAPAKPARQPRKEVQFV